MPEGPELHFASRFVSRVCNGRVFTGTVVKSPIHKSDEVPFHAQSYVITAASRGKEMQLILSEIEDQSTGKAAKGEAKKPKKLADLKTMKILFRFGMSGKFQFTTVSDVHKHSHLQFFTNDDPCMVLTHVDPRRFGRWEIDADWSKERGPDPMFEYQLFRSNVVHNIKSSAFDRPICEVLLNQKYFNGIGNYLRAEILYRLSIPPFEKARDVLEGLDEKPPEVKPKVKGQEVKVKIDDPRVDILHLCHTVPLEVVNLGGSGYNSEGKSADYSLFNAWLQCYYQPGMNNLIDHNKRTIWFKGPAGPMIPRECKSRSQIKKRKKSETIPVNKDESPTKKAKADQKATEKNENKRKTQHKTPTKIKVSTPSRKSSKKIGDNSKKVKNITRQAETPLLDAPKVKGYATRSKVTINGMKTKTPKRKTAKHR